MYRYSLEKGSKKYICPECKKKTFVRYIDQENGSYLGDIIGRCDKEIKCGYHYPPKDFFIDSPGSKKPQLARTLLPVSKQEFAIPISFIDAKLFRKSLRQYEANNLMTFLTKMLSQEEALKLAQKYHIGTAQLWKGASIFWQIDTKHKIRTGKIMLYDPNNGRRIKHPFNHISWVHSYLKKQERIKEYRLDQCLFGLHQISVDKSNKPVGIVESEKTALILSAYFPDLIWMATGGLNNLKDRTLAPLKNRKILFYPDLGAFDKWDEKTKTLRKKGFNIEISDMLESFSSFSDLEEGWDLADYIVKESLINRVLEEENNSSRLLCKMIERNPVLEHMIDTFRLKEDG